MEHLLLKVLIGFTGGTLIGLTGRGGGVLLLPMLIFGLHIPAIIAVGSDALFNFFTKIPASIMHLRKGTVRKRVVLAMAVGSIPGSYLGVMLLAHLRQVYGNHVNDFIKSAVGLLLVLIPTLLLFQGRIEDHLAKRQPTMQSFAFMSVIGLVGGFLVGITSVGSGSIIMMLLLLFYSFAPKIMVGTDIANAVILTGVTSLLHYRAGNVDGHLVGALLIGSIPGGMLGSHLSTRVPVLWLRGIVCRVWRRRGARMLWACFPPVGAGLAPSLSARDCGREGGRRGKPRLYGT